MAVIFNVFFFLITHFWHNINFHLIIKVLIYFLSLFKIAHSTHFLSPLSENEAKWTAARLSMLLLPLLLLSLHRYKSVHACACTHILLTVLGSSYACSLKLFDNEQLTAETGFIFCCNALYAVATSTIRIAFLWCFFFFFC